MIREFMRLQHFQGISTFFKLIIAYLAKTNRGNEILECLLEKDSPIMRIILTQIRLVLRVCSNSSVYKKVKFLL